MKRLAVLVLLMIALTGCGRTWRHALPTATPEMLIRRPENAYSGTPIRTPEPTPEPFYIILTVTAWARPQKQTEVPSKLDPIIIGDFQLDYLGYTRGKYISSDEEYIEISYRFTNNSKETEAFGYNISTKAFQDGIELPFHIVIGSELSTEIRPGKSITVIDGFQLRSNSPVIELEFEPMFSLFAQPVRRTLVMR